MFERALQDLEFLVALRTLPGVMSGLLAELLVADSAVQVGGNASAAGAS